MRNFLLLMVLFSVISSCGHKSVTENWITPDYLLAKDVKQATFLGDNDDPTFSPDGTHLLYSSKSRLSHKGAQIYELDLKKSKERRITYSDGDAFHPIYLSEDEIVYSSTTDEIKESPLRNKKFDKEFPPAELYTSDRFGAHILRLTQQPGYDGEPHYAALGKSRHLIFAAQRGELTGIFRLDFKKLPVSFISVEKGKEKRYPAISPDSSQIFWVEKDLKTSEQKLIAFKMKGRIPSTLKEKEGHYRDLVVAPRAPLRLFYSILRSGEKHFQLEVLDIEKQCTQVIFKGQDSLLSPAVSDTETEQLAFARQFQDKKQIYVVQLPKDLGPCLESGSQVP